MGKTSLTVTFTVSHKGKSDSQRQREKIRALLVHGSLRDGFDAAEIDLDSMEFVGHPEMETWRTDDPVLDCCDHRESSHEDEGCIGSGGPEETADVCPCTVKRIYDHAFAGSDSTCGHPMDHPGEPSLEYPGGEPTKATSEVCGLPESAHKVERFDESIPKSERR